MIAQAEFLNGRSLSALSTEEWTMLKDLERQLRLRKVQQKQNDLYAWMEALALAPTLFPPFATMKVNSIRLKSTGVGS